MVRITRAMLKRCRSSVSRRDRRMLQTRESSASEVDASRRSPVFLYLQQGI